MVILFRFTGRKAHGEDVNDTHVIRRYPFAPLAEVLGMSERGAAHHLGVTGSTEQRYRRDGMTMAVADRLAIRAGRHPFELWPEMADHIIETTRRRWRETKRQQRSAD